MVLLKRLRKLKQKEKEVRILVLGLDNAGKTTIIKKLNGEDVTTISPTLGFNISLFSHRGYKLNIWDVGGQRALRHYWRNYFESTDGLIWVVDSADEARFTDCRAALHSLLQEEQLAGATLLVLANKQDLLPDVATREQIAERLNLAAIKSTHHYKVGACSAYTGKGIVEGLDWLLDDISSRIFTRE